MGAYVLYTTANQETLMNYLLCRFHPLQGHVEVLTSSSSSLGGCSAREQDVSLLYLTGGGHANKSARPQNYHTGYIYMLFSYFCKL
jgi:hypothetical protein